MNFENENPTVVPSVGRAEFRAISNRDYRRQQLPSVFGAETKCFFNREGAQKWLESLGDGGKIEAWSAKEQRYELLATIEAAEVAAK